MQKIQEIHIDPALPSAERIQRKLIDFFHGYALEEDSYGWRRVAVQHGVSLDILRFEIEEYGAFCGGIFRKSNKAGQKVQIAIVTMAISQNKGGKHSLKYQAEASLDISKEHADE